MVYESSIFNKYQVELRVSSMSIKRRGDSAALKEKKLKEWGTTEDAGKAKTKERVDAPLAAEKEKKKEKKNRSVHPRGPPGRSVGAM